MKRLWGACVAVVVTTSVGGAVEISTTNLPNGMEMVSYSATLVATNGTSPYKWEASEIAVWAWGRNIGSQTNVPSGLSNAVAVAGGLYHSVALKSDGGVVAWGTNNFGQTNIPVGLSNVVAVAARNNHSLALKSDGRVVAWGFGYYGQTNVPAGLTNAVAISAGMYHSMALKSDGRVAVWGNNSTGQTNVPAGLSNVVAVGAGWSHNLAVKSDGTVVAWGDNQYGQTNVPVGLSNVMAVAGSWYHSLALKSDGTVVPWGTTGSVPDGLSNVVALAAGTQHNLALRSDGTIVAWGGNEYGQINVPNGLSNAIALAAGDYHSIALGGLNAPLPGGLQLSTAGVLSGTPVDAGTNLIKCTVRDATGAWAHRVLQMVVEPTPNAQPLIHSNSPPAGAVSMAEASNQVFRVWATDPEGSNLTYSWTWDAVGVGGNDPAYTHTTAWGDAGPHTLRCYVSDGLWNDVYAQWAVTVLADYDADGMPDQWEVGYFGDRSRDGSGDYDGDGMSDLDEYNAGRNPVIGLPDITTASLPIGTEMVPYTAILQATDGTPPYAWTTLPEVVAWGDDGWGQTEVPSDLRGAVQFAAGWGHSMALRSDGSIVAWGADAHGQSTVPERMGGVVDIAAGHYHSLALRSDGTVVAWGINDYGESTVPRGLGQVVDVDAGGSHSLALLSNGTVVAWGNNDSGQLNIPDGLSNVVEIAAGGGHNLALRSNGTVVAWGSAFYEETNVPSGLSDVVAVAAESSLSMALKSDGTVVAWGSYDGGSVAVPDALSNVIAIAAGNDHSLALRSDGTVVAFGYNSHGQTNVPVGLSNVVGIAAGGNHSLALRNSMTLLPEGLSCSTNGIISGMPTLAGTSLVTFVVWDVDGAAAARVVEIVIEANANAAPTIISNSPPTGAFAMAGGTNQLFQVWAADPEGGTLTYAWTWDDAIVGDGSPAYTLATQWGDTNWHTLRCYVSDDLWTNVVCAQWDIGMPADYDADGLPDEWEVRYFGDRSHDGTGNEDGDALSNAEEYLTDHNPTVPQSPNDDFAHAYDMGSAAQWTTNVCISDCILEEGEPDLEGFGGASVWFEWQAPEDGFVLLDTYGSEIDTVLAVFEGADFGGFSTCGWNDDCRGATWSRVGFWAVAGSTYRIAVHGYHGQEGNIALSLRMQQSGGPLNDDFANAIDMASARSWSTTGSNIGATLQTDLYGQLESDVLGAGGASVWYRWSAPSDGWVTVDTFGSDFDTVLVVTGEPPEFGWPVPLANNNDDQGGATVQSRVRIYVRAGQIYCIAVHGNHWAQGNFNLNLAMETAPPPDNDDRMGAVYLGNASELTAYGSNVGASWGRDEWTAGLEAGSVWFSWQAPTNGDYVIDTMGSDFDTVLIGGNDYQQFASDDDCGAPHSRIGIRANGGETLYFAVAGYEGPYEPAAGDIVLHIEKAPAPLNDDFTNAVDLGSVTNAIIQRECFNTTLEEDEPDWSPRESGTAWWRWQAPADGTLILTRGTDYDEDPLMDWCVFTNSSLSALQAVVDPSDWRSQVTFDVVAGTVYQIALSPRIDLGDEYHYTDGIPVVDMGLDFQPRPGNDIFANAIDLGSVLETNEVTFSNIAAQDDEADGNYVPNGVWFRWQAPADARVEIDIHTVEPEGSWPNGPYIFVDNDGTMTRVDDGMGGFSAELGVTYFILFGSDAEGAWELDLDADVRPPNDNFLAAFDMTGAESWLTNGTLHAASFETDEPRQYYLGSVWYTWQAGADGRVGLTVFNSDMRHGLTTRGRDVSPNVAVYAGSSLAELALVANGEGQVEFDAVAGTSYRIAVTSAYDWGDDGDFLLNLQPVVRPTNDDFANAANLGSSTGVVVETSNLFGTTEDGENAEWRHSLWWRWQAPADGTVDLLFSLPASQGSYFTYSLIPLDFRVSALTGTGLADLVEMPGSVRNGRGAAFRVFGGSNYWIAGYSRSEWWYGDMISLGDVGLRLQFMAPPANDDFADATDLGNGYYAEGDGDNWSATTETDEPPYGMGSVWWKWQAPADGIVELNDNSFSDTTRVVFSGTDLASLTPVSMDSGRFSAVAGTSYYIMYCDGFYGASDIRFELELFTPPANDMFADATDLGSTTNVVVTGNYLGATWEEGDPLSENTLWWRWQAPTNGTAYMDMDADWATLAVFEGPDLAGLNQVAWVEGGDRWFDTIAGTSYWIGLGGHTSGGYDSEFDLRLQFAIRPVNDDFADAIKLGNLEPVSVTGNNEGATTEPGEGGTVNRSVWWRWHAPHSGTVTIDSSSEDFDPYVSMFTGQSIFDLSGISEETDPPRNFPGHGLRIDVDEGMGYSISVACDGWWTYGRGGTFTFNIAYPPLNDDLAMAIDISADKIVTQGDNYGASGEVSDGGWEWESADNNVWWQWKAPRDGSVSIDTIGSDFEHQLNIFVKDPHSFRPLADDLYPWDLLGMYDRHQFGRDNENKLTFEARASQVYYISVEGEGGARGNIVLRVQTAPTNDHFAAASPLPSAPSVTVTGSTAGASSERGEPLADEGQSAWWSWQAPTTGLVSIDTFGSDFDTVLSVWTGTNVASLARRRYCDDADTNGISRVRFFAEAGSNHYVRVHGKTFWDAGDAVLNVAAIAPPVTADDHVIWGRAYLEERSGEALAQADSHFAQALVLDANHAEANLLRGVTRFAMLQQEPEFQSMLEALGVVTLSNDIYHARYDLNTDTNGVPTFAAGATTDLPLDYIRNHVEPRLEEIRAMWDRITDPAFRTSFSDAETGSAFVQVDYGDALMLKGLPPAAKAAWTLADTYNLQSALETAMQMMRDGLFDAQHVVDTFQQMLEFRASDRRQEFKSNYLAANQAYQSASSFIRNLRVTSDERTHLFSVRRTGLAREERIRESAQEGADSLNGAVVDIEGQQIAVSDFMATTNSLRDFLPSFMGNKVVAFSTPDVTFGGTWRNGTHATIHDELRRHDLLYELTGFSAWAALNLAGVAENERTRGANPDNDPLNNLLEYAFNLDPMRANIAAEFAMPDLVSVTGSGAGQYLALTFVRRISRPDLQYIVAVSDDLITWDRTGSQVEPWGDPLPTGDGTTEQVTYRLKADVALAGRKFLRLEIIENP